MKKTATFYYKVWRRDDQKTVRAGKVTCNIDDPQGMTHKALQECKKAARLYVCDTGEAVGYTIGGSKTPIAEDAKRFMEEADRILYHRIVKPVPDIIKQMTVEGITRYGMELHDSFKAAVCSWAKKGTKLYKAWYKDDFREYIPSEYDPKYLDFNKYPLAY